MLWLYPYPLHLPTYTLQHGRMGSPVRAPILPTANPNSLICPYVAEPGFCMQIWSECSYVSH
jgi:hypothetical protein